MSFRWVLGTGTFLKPEYACNITFGLDGQTYHFNNLEAAYQSFKCPERMYEFTRLSAEKAKELGKTVELREDWEDIKNKVYIYLSGRKFEGNKDVLMKTDNDTINRYLPPKWADMLIKIRDFYRNNPDLDTITEPNANHLCEAYVNRKEQERNINAEKALQHGILFPLSESKTNHSMAVASFMKAHANFWGISPSEAYVVGMLHDIGYLYGRGNHEENGSKLLEGMGLAPEYVTAIRLHGTAPNTIDMDSLTEKEKVLLSALYEADMSIDARGNQVGFEGRLTDIATRYGKDHIAYKTAKAEVEFIKVQMEERSAFNEFLIAQIRENLKQTAEDRSIDKKSSKEFEKSSKKENGYVEKA